jgi:hypothetical protein
VPGGEPSRPERVSELQHRVEAHLAVTAHARVRRATGGVARDEAVDHLGAKTLTQVERLLLIVIAVVFTAFSLFFLV